MSKTLPYNVLNQKNKELHHDVVKKYNILYEGGEEILEHASLFIHKDPMESEASYKSRLKSASYKNYLSQIVNDYISETFSKKLSIVGKDGEKSIELDPEYLLFHKDADLQGNNLQNICQKVLTDAVVSGKSFLGIDLPKTDQRVESRLQEEMLGLARPYVYHINYSSVLDYEKDNEGKFTFLILKKERCVRKGISDLRNSKVIQFKIWEKIDQEVFYKIYEREVEKEEEIDPETEFYLIEEGVVSFKDIPVVCLDIPYNLWIGNLVGNLCESHFRRESSLVNAMNRSLFAIAVFKQGPELDESGNLSEIGSNPYRGSQAVRDMRQKNFAITGPKDEIYFAEPSGNAYDLTNQHLKELVDEIYRIVNQMSNSISATSKALNRAASSREIDQKGKEMVLEAYGSIVEQFVIKVHKLISEARAEEISWESLGLSNYKSTNRELVLKEATELVGKLEIPSKTFHKNYLIKIALLLDGDLSPEDQDLIKQEINEAVDAGYLDKEKTEDIQQKQQPLE